MSDAGAKRGLKLVLGLFVYGLTICVVLVAGVFWWGAAQFQKEGPLQESRLFTVERGQGANTIAYKLYEENLIHDPYIFMIGTTVLGAHTDLKAGEYELSPGMSAQDLMHLLRGGKTVVRRFTIREGLTSYEIVQHLKHIEALSGGVGAVPPEGSLLPNTYDFQLNEPREKILMRLQNNMIDTIKTACKIDRENLSFVEVLRLRCGQEPLETVHDVLTLASIVEKETAVAHERNKVAGVFINRLKRGIALQTDPTVIYAITKGKHKNEGKGPLGRRLLKKDLAIDSPYNTYKHAGLPPGPIANPGKASIEAVLAPESHDYIFFVADGTGGHAFAKTLKEHNENVAKWRKIRRLNR